VLILLLQIKVLMAWLKCLPNIKSGRSDILDIELSLVLLLFISGSSLLLLLMIAYDMYIEIPNSLGHQRNK